MLLFSVAQAASSGLPTLPTTSLLTKQTSTKVLHQTTDTVSLLHSCYVFVTSWNFVFYSLWLKQEKCLSLRGGNDIDWRYFVAGGICAATSHGITTPIDVVKTKMQTSPEKYKDGVISAARDIIKTEGKCSTLPFPIVNRTHYVCY